MAKKKSLVKLCKNCDQKLDRVDAANKQIHGCSFHQIRINNSCLKHFFSKENCRLEQALKLCQKDKKGFFLFSY
jgi:hypothetical protein